MMLQNRYRALIVFLSFLCLSSIGSNYIIMNFTFICMKDDFSQTITEGNVTRSAFDYTTSEKSAIIWSVAFGTALGTFPINVLYTKYGARFPFFIAGLLSFVATLFMPIAASEGLYYLLALRFIQGIAYAADFSAIGLICVKWAPISELAIFICVLTGFSPFSAFVTNIVSGKICVSSLGWRYSYYFHAFAGLIVFILWFIVYTDEPSDHERVSSRELQKIQKGKSSTELEKVTTVPYSKIISNPQILCVWFNSFFEMTSMVLVSTYAPLYFNRVLNFGIDQTGVVVSLATIAQVPFKLTAAIFSDKVKYFSERSKMLFFNTLSVGFVGILFAVLGFLPLSVPVLSVIVFAGMQILSSTSCGGFYKCGTLVSRQYGHVVIGAIQWMKCVALFTSPALVQIFVHEETNQSDWMKVFVVAAIGLLTANFLAYPLFSSEPAEFTKSKEEKTQIEELRPSEARPCE